MDPRQSRMARAATGRGVREIAALAKVSTATITRLENGEELKPRTVDDIQRAYESEGVKFVQEDEWVGVMVKLPE